MGVSCCTVTYIFMHNTSTGEAITKSIMNLKIGNALEISNINTLYIAEYRVYYRTASCVGLGSRSKWMRAVAAVAAFRSSVTERPQGVFRESRHAQQPSEIGVSSPPAPYARGIMYVLSGNESIICKSLHNGLGPGLYKGRYEPMD